MKQRFVALAVAAAIAFLGTPAATAATFTVRLVEVRTTSPNGDSVAVLNADGGDWAWDDAALTVTSSSTYDTQFIVGPNPFFRHIVNGYIVDASGAAATADATDFDCIEGAFGGQIGIHICSGINLGPNFTFESSATWGPGLAFDRQLNTNPFAGGDDFINGDQMNLNGLFDGMSVTSWDGQTLVVGNFVPAVTGYQLTFVIPAAAVDDPNYGAASGSAGNVLDIGANDVRWAPNPAVVDDVSGTGTGTGSLGGTFTINTDPDIANVTVTYDAPAATGNDTWVYRVTDTEGLASGQTDTATVTVAVAASGTANDDTAATIRLLEAVPVPVGQNDVGFNDPATVTVTNAPMQGTATIAGSPGAKDAITVTYQSTAPLATATYTDTFTYQITDGTATDTADVTVTVNNTIPVADDLGGVTLDTQGVSPSDASTDVNVGNGGDIATNDLGDQPSVVTTAPANDVTTSVAGSTITITATAFTSAGDAVGYTITDADGEADTGTIAVSIPDVAPQVPDIAATIDVAGAVEASITVVLGNGAAADHTYAYSPPQWGTITDFEVSDGPGAGQATAEFIYQPTGFAATEVVTIEVRDGDGSAGTGTITATITGNAVTIEAQDSLPGNSNALGPVGLALLFGIPLLRGRRRRR